MFRVASVQVVRLPVHCRIPVSMLFTLLGAMLFTLLYALDFPICYRRFFVNFEINFSITSDLTLIHVVYSTRAPTFREICTLQGFNALISCASLFLKPYIRFFSCTF